jgi:hypothetical protein
MISWWEDSSEFWRMIAERRRETSTVSLEEFIAELEIKEKQERDKKVEVDGDQSR